MAPLLRDLGKQPAKRTPSPIALGTSRTSNGFGILDTPRSNLKLKREKENKTYSRGGLGKVTRVEQEDTWIDNTNDPEYALNLVKENRSPVPGMRQPRRSLFSEVSNRLHRRLKVLFFARL